MILPRSGGACPAILRTKGALDLTALTELLHEVAAALPRCEAEVLGPAKGGQSIAIHSELGEHCALALISADLQTPWQDVVSVSDAAAAAGFTRARLRRRVEPTPTSCSSAISVAELRARFSGP